MALTRFGAGRNLTFSYIHQPHASNRICIAYIQYTHTEKVALHG